MTVRKISPEENALKLKIQSIAFFFSKDPNAGGTNAVEQITDHTTCRAAFSDDGKMCSCLDLIPFEASFDGKTVKTGGIGGVASLPEERQKRYIRSIFEHIIPEMYDSDYTFSYLYPFSHKYYRKFGYEQNMLRRNISIPIECFRNLDRSDSVELYTSGTEPIEVKELYAGFIKDKNLSIVRGEKLWKQFLAKDPYKDNVYLYIWRDSSGRAGSYVKFGLDRIQGAKPNLQIQEFIWRDREAFRGMLGFIGGFTAQADKIVWPAPEYVNMMPFMTEPYELKQEIWTFGMNRIVNAEKALKLMKTPEGRGQVTIAVTDEFFPINSGCYTIVWEGGAHSVSRTGEAPDLGCDIQALSQLITGYCTVKELYFAGRIEINGKEELLSQVFPKKPLFINNYF